MPDRLVLTGGFPPEPGTGWEELAATPGPLSLLDAVFAEFARVNVNDMARREEDAAAHEGDGRQTRVFIFEKDGAGYRIEESRSLETSALPAECTLETYGLQELTIHWTYALEQAGQLGHVAYRHGRFEAQCGTAAARGRLEDIWQRVYGHPPAFSPA